MGEFDNGLEEKFEFDFSDPCISKVKVDELKSFIEKDKAAVIVFYGGEPLLQINKIKEIMDNIDVPFRMQTNGILLNKLEPEYLNKITKILISLDGGEKTTDKYRGEKTYSKVLSNIEEMKTKGYKGELIARMTVAQDNPDIYKNTLALIKAGFTSIHWQLDVGFYKEDYDKEKILSFLEEYNKSLSKLVDYWTEEIEKGNVLRLYPFLGIAESILKGEPTKIRCGAGHEGYAISTSGKVVACPIMNNIESFKAGDLNTDPSDLKKFEMSECKDCEVLDLCGGRCMYWKKAKLWPEEGNEMVCNSIKHYIKEIQLIMPRVIEAINTDKVRQSDFNYEKYFGPEIIP
jgi:putative peptide-modifying radical SAM enzyme